MTEKEFDDAWDRYELDYEFSEYCYDHYPIDRDAAYKDFRESKITVWEVEK